MLSEDLKKARIEAGLTIEDVAKQLNIRKRYLIELEENNLDALPDKVYVDGYIKLYAQFLKIELPETGNKNDYEVKTPIIEKNSRFKIYVIIMSLIMLVIILMLYSMMTKMHTGL